MKKYKRVIDKRIDECKDGGNAVLQCRADLELMKNVRTYMDATGCPSISQAVVDLIKAGYEQFAIELVVSE